MKLASAVASVSAAAPASASVAASASVQGRLKVAQLGRLGQPPVLLAVAPPGKELSLSLAALAASCQSRHRPWGEPLVAAAAGADLELHFPSLLSQEVCLACLTQR